jgi:hypothetical protein
MSYSRRLENVLEQIDTVENNLNKKLIQEFATSNLKRYTRKLSKKLYQNYVDVCRFFTIKK